MIYDARIAFALNTIHFMRGINARAFPVPQGRNRLMSTMDTQIMAALGYLEMNERALPELIVDVAHPKLERKRLKALSNWLRGGVIREDDTYAYYLAVMARVNEVMGKDNIQGTVEC